MSNHVHFLLKEGEEDIYTTLKRIGVSFVRYYNWKYRISGPFFQDRFKSENVEDVTYLVTAARYIHQNPVKAGIVNLPDEWKWSNCPGYYGKNTYPTGLLDEGYILNMFSTEKHLAIESFRQFTEQRVEDSSQESEPQSRTRLTDDEARQKIKMLLGTIEFAQVKTLPKEKRTTLLRKIKRINGIFHRQAARILGVSSYLIFRA